MNVLHHEKRVALVTLFLQGMSASYAARTVGCNRNTAMTLRHQLKGGEVPELVAEARGETPPASPSAPKPPQPQGPPRGFVEWEGRLVQLKTLCGEHGLPVATVRGRMRKGAGIVDALRVGSALVGKRFGRFVVLECGIGGNKKKALCRCDCGAEKLVRVNYLQKHWKKRGQVCSCGCYHLEKISGGTAPTHVEVFGKRLSMGELGVLAKLRPTTIWAGMRRGLSPEVAAFGAAEAS